MAQVRPGTSIVGAATDGSPEVVPTPPWKACPPARRYRRQASEEYAARAASLEGSPAGEPARSPSAGRVKPDGGAVRTPSTADYAARAEAIENRLAGDPAQTGGGPLLDGGRTASTRTPPSSPSAEITTGPSTGALSSVSMRMLGSDSVGEAPVTREELMEQGLPVSHASARVVRQHEQQMLQQSFGRVILSFILLICLMTPVLLAMFIWLAVEWNAYRETICDVPLQTWCYVVNIVMVFNTFLRKFIVKSVCGWDPAAQDPPARDEVSGMPTEPLRVKVFNASITIFMSLWNCVGLYWVSVSGTVASESPSCKDAAPGLWHAVRAYAVVNLCFTIVVYVYLIGVLRILAIMMRAGMLQSNQRAPPGSLEANTERVNLSDPLVKENKSCSICMEDFSATKDIVKTKVCGHVFHKQCLNGWLNVNRNCPLCRRDLGTTSRPSSI